MTTHRIVSTANAPLPAGAYVQARRVGCTLYSAGFGPHDPETNLISGGIREQTLSTIENLKRVLEAEGMTLDDVVKVTAHLSDLSMWADFDAAFGEGFPGLRPARITVGSQLAGILVELDVVAVAVG